jgi:hypothetical protein
MASTEHQQTPKLQIFLTLLILSEQRPRLRLRFGHGFFNIQEASSGTADRCQHVRIRPSAFIYWSLFGNRRGAGRGKLPERVANNQQNRLGNPGNQDRQGHVYLYCVYRNSAVAFYQGANDTGGAGIGVVCVLVMPGMQCGHGEGQEKQCHEHQRHNAFAQCQRPLGCRSPVHGSKDSISDAAGNAS